MITNDSLRYKILSLINRGTQKKVILDALDCTPLEAEAILQNLSSEGYLHSSSDSFSVTSYGREYRLALGQKLDEEAERKAYEMQVNEQEHAEHRKDRWNAVIVLLLGSLLSNLDRLIPFLCSLFIN